MQTRDSVGLWEILRNAQLLITMSRLQPLGYGLFTVTLLERLHQLVFEKHDGFKMRIKKQNIQQWRGGDWGSDPWERPTDGGRDVIRSTVCNRENRQVFCCPGWGVVGYSPLLSEAGRGTNWGGGGAHLREIALEEWRGRIQSSSSSSSPLVLRLFPVSSPHSAVASQLVLRGTWRHLVSVIIRAGTAGGWGRFCSVPVAGDDAAEARLQGVTGAGTPGEKKIVIDS